MDSIGLNIKIWRRATLTYKLCDYQTITSIFGCKFYITTKIIDGRPMYWIQMPYYEILHVDVSTRVMFKHIDVILTPIPKIFFDNVLTVEFRQPLNSYI